MRSSYKKNNYGQVFEHLIYAFTPQICVELGVLDGYSTLHIAKGLKKIKQLSNHTSHLYAFDLWDDYAYKHGSMADVQKMLEANSVSEFVTLQQSDAFKVPELFSDLSVCFVHIDISNDGDVLKKMIKLWHPKITFGGGMILFEGGSEERDNVDWMKSSFNKTSIKKEMEKNTFINAKFNYGTWEAFPSLSALIKKS